MKTVTRFLNLLLRALTPVVMLVWRPWSAACDLADRRVFTPYGRYAPWAAFAALAVACVIAAR